MKEPKSKGLSGIAEIVIALVIVNHVFRIITNLFYLSSGIIDSLTGVWHLIAGVSMIVILLGVLKLKRWSWHAFVCIQLINVLFITLIQGDDIVVPMGVAIIMCVVLRGLLAIKRDGVSAWDVMFKKEKSDVFAEADDEKNKLSDSEIVVEEPINNNSTESVDDSIPFEQENVEEKDLNTSPQVTIIQANNSTEKDNRILDKHHSKTTKWILTLCGVLMLFLISFTVFISTKTYPEYISDYGDKLKYTLNIPNNKLADKLFEEAINSRHSSDFFIKDMFDPIISSSVYYDNLPEYLERFTLNGVYTVEDTVKQKSDIIEKGEYAMCGEYSNYKWIIKTGGDLIHIYDEWMSMSNDLWDMIIRIQYFDAKEAYAKEHSLVDNVTKIPIDDIDVINKIANYYKKENNYNKVADIYESATEYDKNNPALLGELALAKYFCSDFEKSREFATKALQQNPKEVSALQAMAQLEADELNWREAKKYAKKAVDYGSENAEPYFIYAQAIYKEGEIDKAHEYYNKAYNINKNSALANKYSECAGCPIEILSIVIGFSENGTSVINQKEFNSSKILRLHPMAKIRTLRCEDLIKVQLKIFKNGNLCTGYDSPNGYTYEEDFYCGTPTIIDYFFTKTGGLISQELGYLVYTV